MFKSLKENISYLKKKINGLEESNYFNTLKIEDLYSFNLLLPLISDYPFVPFTGSSLRPFCINHILNDITLNDRKHIIEFGSGISTILIGRLIKKNNLCTVLISVDHNKKWIDTLSSMLQKEALDTHIKLVCAPLEKCELAIENNEWYDIEILNKALSEYMFDMVIVDGPPSWKPGNEKSRYPVMPFIYRSLSQNFSVYLDDASRAGEKSI